MTTTTKLMEGLTLSDAEIDLLWGGDDYEMRFAALRSLAQRLVERIDAAASHKGEPVAWAHHSNIKSQITPECKRTWAEDLTRDFTIPLHAHPPVQEQPKASEERDGDSYDAIWNALQRIDTAAAFLPTYTAKHEGDIEAFTQNIIDAIAPYARNGEDHEVSKPNEQKDAAAHPIQAHSKSQYKRLSDMGADVVPPAAHPLSDAWMEEAERLVYAYGSSVMGRYKNGYWQVDGQRRCDEARAALLAHLRSRVQPDAALLRQALAALEYHEAQTRPIAETDSAISALREAIGEKT